MNLSDQTNFYIYGPAGVPVEQVATYGYDDLNRRTSMTDGTGTSFYAYDSLDRLTSHTRGGGQVIGYAYDLNNNLTKLTYPGSLDVTRTYDDVNRFTSLTDWLGKITRFTYDPNSNQTSTEPHWV
jgi:YD repeat-containing protein